MSSRTWDCFRISPSNETSGWFQKSKAGRQSGLVRAYKSCCRWWGLRRRLRRGIPISYPAVSGSVSAWPVRWPQIRMFAGFLSRACVRCAQVPGRVATGAFVRRAHALGLDVHVWTINDRAEMIRFLDLGADGIMTDDIETLRDVMIQRGQWHPRSG